MFLLLAQRKLKICGLTCQQLRETKFMERYVNRDIWTTDEGYCHVRQVTGFYVSIFRIEIVWLKIITIESILGYFGIKICHQFKRARKFDQWTLKRSRNAEGKIGLTYFNFLATELKLPCDYVLLFVILGNCTGNAKRHINAQLSKRQHLKLNLF